MVFLEEKELEILEILEKNSCILIDSILKMVDLMFDEIFNIVKKLEREKVIV